MPFKVIQGHRFSYQLRAHMRLSIENLYFTRISNLVEINTNLRPILHRFRDVAFDRSKITIFGYPSCV